jgi:hypothetical protein
MTNGPRVGTGARRLAALAAVAAVFLGSVSCSKDEFEKNAEGFNIEPAAEPGPDAFTPTVVSGETQNAMGGGAVEGELAQAGSGGACDTKKFVAELQKRPDAYKEWARVLGLKPDQVPAYVDSLDTVVLTKDTKVTNHGIHNGKAYARQSVLTAGTAVMVDKNPGDGPRASTTTSSAPPPTGPAGGIIVTRCKCGNPLLPPGDPSKPVVTAPDTEAPGTSEPGTTTRGATTRGTTPGSSAGRSTTTRSGSTTVTTRSGATTTRGSGSGDETTSTGPR